MPKGHAEGNLNFVAIRNGWERQISLTPAEVDNMSYLTLESLLELDTLKLRAQNLRIFVEHPPASGVFDKICPWQEDGTLQSALVKSFFEERMRNGTITTLDVRDMREEIQERDGAAPLSRSPKAKGWLRATGLVKTKSHSHGLHNFMGGTMNESPELPRIVADYSPNPNQMFQPFASQLPPRVPPKSTTTGSMLSPPSTPEGERYQSQGDWSAPRRTSSRATSRRSHRRRSGQSDDEQEPGNDVDTVGKGEGAGHSRDDENIVKSSDKVALWRKGTGDAYSFTDSNGTAPKSMRRESYVQGVRHGQEGPRAFSPVTSRTYSPAPTTQSYTPMKVKRRQTREDVKVANARPVRPAYAASSRTSGDSDSFIQEKPPRQDSMLADTKPARLPYAASRASHDSEEFPQEVSVCSDSDSEY